MAAVKTDILVIGSGIAGLAYAARVAQLMPKTNILIVTKGNLQESNTRYAQGGIAAVLDHLEDSFEQHIADTLSAGAGLCDPVVVELVVREGPEHIRELMSLGAAFDRDTVGGPALGREGGHSRHRIVHSRDRTGLEIQKTLLKAIRKYSNIRVLTGHFATDLRKDNHGTCIGTQLIDTKGKVLEVVAGQTVLATGGVGQVYEVTTNPVIATGDGIAMAMRAGAAIEDMAFIQFHPTALYEPDQNPPFLISEAVRGFGAELRNAGGASFMTRYDSRASLATRDVVSRATFLEMQCTGDKHVFLDLRHCDLHAFTRQFPTIYEKCRTMGLDLSVDMIPVVPAAHYVCGGVKTDDRARTSIPGLMCLGESARTGLHGANRLASNSLLEALVFARRAALYTSSGSIARHSVPVPAISSGKQTRANIYEITHGLKFLMTDSAGIIRSHEQLKQAMGRVLEWKNSLEVAHTVEEFTLLNMIDVALLIIEDSLNRKVSQGGLWLEAPVTHEG